MTARKYHDALLDTGQCSYSEYCVWYRCACGISKIGKLYVGQNRVVTMGLNVGKYEVIEALKRDIK